MTQLQLTQEELEQKDVFIQVIMGFDLRIFYSTKGNTYRVV